MFPKMKEKRSGVAPSRLEMMRMPSENIATKMMPIAVS